jgi:Ran-binding protein 3
MTTTGEENESNVLQASCKLFVYDGTTSAWVERGQGQLRLNDRVDGDEPPARKESPRGSGCGSTVANQGYDGEEDVPARPIQSRLIVRTKGSLRLMLNTNVWSGMKVERPSEKSVRFTGNDNGTVRIFVVQSSATDAEVLCNALTCRIRALLSYEAENPGAVVDPAPVYPTSSQTHQTLSQQSSSSGGYSAASGSGSGEFTVKHKREEIDSSEFDDSDEEVLDKTDEEGEETPHTKKKRISSEPEEGASETPSPSTTTNEDIIPEREASVGLGFQHGSRSNIVPSIQVDKPEARSDEDEDEDDAD